MHAEEGQKEAHPKPVETDLKHTPPYGDTWSVTNPRRWKGQTDRQSESHRQTDGHQDQKPDPQTKEQMNEHADHTREDGQQEQHKQHKSREHPHTQTEAEAHAKEKEGPQG